MAYADKCFDFDWWGREVKLESFGNYDCITLRKQRVINKLQREEACVSIELWGRLKDNSDERYDDQEVVLSKDNAMVLATKLMRAVAELDTDERVNAQRRQNES